MNLTDAQRWAQAAPVAQADQLTADADALAEWARAGLDALSSTPRDEPGEGRRVTVLIRDALADTRAQFTRTHGPAVYDAVTRGRSDCVAVEHLVVRLAERFEGLCPSAAALDEDRERSLRDKHGHELSQGAVLAELLAIAEVGLDLMAASRRPTPDSHALLERFTVTDALELGPVTLARVGKAGHLTLANRDCLNAEDDVLNAAMERAVDVVLLDPRIEVGVLRGAAMEHAKYRGRRVFCSGVNLTKLYAGELSYMFYVSRELGLVSKIYRGLFAGGSPAEVPDRGIEKPWVTVVDGHAIGGGCQLVLVSDHVIAASDAYFTIPARTEGFIPGVANLRLPRHVGTRLSHRIIHHNHRVEADSAEGRLLVDEVVDAQALDAAIAAACEIGPGVIANRKALRMGAEPIDLFRRYMATFCLEQAKCMHSAEIVARLEQVWVHRQRGGPRASAPGAGTPARSR